MKPFRQIWQSPRVNLRSENETGFAAIVQARGGIQLRVIASDRDGWDHVSVSCANRTPTYQEMKLVKRLFFKADEWVIEYHPADADYISINDNVLHMWRPQGVDLPKPPPEMI